MAQGLLGALSAASIAETEVICHASAAVCGHSKGAQPLGRSVGWQAMEWVNIVCLVLAFYFGGMIKGATGAGAPIIAIPIISLLYDVPTAVAAFTVPNFLSNVWQSWKFRSHQVTGSFAWILLAPGSWGRRWAL